MAASLSSIVIRQCVNRPAPRPGGLAEEAPARPPKDTGRHPIFGALKDVTWIAPDTDLTAPADPEWADLTESKDWGRLPE